MWFGGSTGPIPLRPANAVPVSPNVPGVWMSTEWPERELVTAAHGERHVLVFGTCAVESAELHRATAPAVPGDVAWRWPGSYVVVEVTPGSVTLWTDLTSALPLYIRRTEDRVLWASSSRLLAGLYGSVEVDLAKVVERLIGPDTAEHGTGSYFTGAERVPAGHRLVLSKGTEPVAGRVWEPKDVGSGHGERLRSALEGAVAVRVDRAARPSTDFSGGFDSTALGLLAAERLAPRGREIVGVTVHPDGVLYGGDLDYAREAAQHPAVLHRLLPLGREHSPYGGLDCVPPTDEPAPSTVSYAYFSAQLRWLSQEVDSDMHMTGDGGDALLLTPPYQLVELLHRGRVRHAFQEAVRWAHVRRMSVLNALRAARSRADPDPVPTWVRITSPVPQGVEDASPRGRTRRMLERTMIHAGRTARADVQLAQAAGVPLHNPYFDSQVVNAYLSVPMEDLPGPARYKPVMADAMRDLFPAKLLARTTKGDASSDHHEGLRRSLPFLMEFVDGHLAQEGLINVSALRNSLSRAALGIGEELAQIESTVATEAWLRTAHRAPAPEWFPDKAVLQ
ncbi:albusnodin/ikarugamycin family macrolactam cyclase [Nocardiopsis sp. N85]|uniref:albusnodin/ikarugamycin family macrolactam cyclase n=1 Tax=Nocardiopsis sp. N85 TaxID=3029400 RepID=UPI00237F8D52|nr:albusnodin/ikarugamycin family macrolactam cyclase [Nocardiopsis sp. N85]MDE3724847.1 albusnodin/ikarugamycin family macrolactam cyclase [Nocardiopsis sp. N85]